MQRRNLSRAQALTQHPIYFYRLSEFNHLYRLQDFITENRQTFQAFLGDDASEYADYMHTLDVAMTGWLVSLLDRAKGSLNVVDLWVALHPERTDEILSRAEKIEPHLKKLKAFRDNAGFHANVSIDHAAIREGTFTPEVAGGVDELFALIRDMLDAEHDIWRESPEAGETVNRIREVARRPVRRPNPDA